MEVKVRCYSNPFSIIEFGVISTEWQAIKKGVVKASYLAWVLNTKERREVEVFTLKCLREALEMYIMNSARNQVIRE